MASAVFLSFSSSALFKTTVYTAIPGHPFLPARSDAASRAMSSSVTHSVLFFFKSISASSGRNTVSSIFFPNTVQPVYGQYVSRTGQDHRFVFCRYFDRHPPGSIRFDEHRNIPASEVSQARRLKVSPACRCKPALLPIPVLTFAAALLPSLPRSRTGTIPVFFHDVRRGCHEHRYTRPDILVGKPVQCRCLAPLRRPRIRRALSPELFFLQFQRLSQRVCPYAACLHCKYRSYLFHAVTDIHAGLLLKDFSVFRHKPCLSNIPVLPCRRSSFLPSDSNHMPDCWFSASSSIRCPDLHTTISASLPGMSAPFPRIQFIKLGRILRQIDTHLLCRDPFSIYTELPDQSRAFLCPRHAAWRLREIFRSRHFPALL